MAEHYVALVAADRWGVITKVTGDVEEVTGRSQEDLEGRPLVDIIPPRYREAHLKGFAQYRRTGKGTVFGRELDLPLLGPDGTEHPIKLKIYKFDFSTGEVLSKLSKEKVTR